jgi:hypothetical protein
MKRYLLIAMIAACGKGGSGGGSSNDLPKLTQMPPGAEGLVIGASTEAQVTAKFPGAEISKDKSFGGGDMVVEYNEHKAEVVRLAKTTATLWKDAGGTLRLMKLEMYGDGLCDWATKTATAMKAGACGGNRKMDPGEHQWCVASADGALKVVLDCETGLQGGNQLDIHVFDD